ncbi:kinase-like protein [Atractiella rhizophila]|nr:kinase-like protein [Atractiella rhizophila]
MLLQGATLVRLAQDVINSAEETKNEPWRFVLICCYVTNELMVKRYLMCCEDMQNPSEKVVYQHDAFDLQEPAGVFKFLLELYNFPDIMKPIDPFNILTNLERAVVKPLRSFYSTGRTKSGKRKATDEDKGDQSHGRAAKSQRLNIPAVTKALLDAGYSIVRLDASGWTIVDETPSISYPSVATVCRRDGKRFIVKIVESPEFEETAIHRSLARIDDRRNHTIKIVEVLECEGDQLLILPLGVPLCDLSFKLGNRFNSTLAISLCHQLIDGVGFMHSQGFAHLDLKPDNLVVIDKTLHIIDFGLSRRVAPDTTLKGFRGTKTWVAPEVGENDGPKQTYEAIPVDLWATGTIILRFFGLYLPDNHQLLDIARQLTAHDPKSRPRLDGMNRSHKRRSLELDVPISKHRFVHSLCNVCPELNFVYSRKDYLEQSPRPLPVC